ncbi:MAG: glycosyltransferase 87 family protein [Solirubrobacterales bacterium]
MTADRRPAATLPATETAGRTAAPAWEAETSNRAAPAALALLLAVYVALAALWSEPGSDVVLATGGGSPGWLLGPLQPLGAGFADGGLSGPLFYAGLWAALALYCAVLAGAAHLGWRTVAAAVVGAHVLFALAPPLLSQDAFSYIAYARLDVVHDLNPYLHSPSDVTGDPVYPFAGSKDFTSVYGPLFTVLTLPLAKTSVPFAFWTLKVVAALASLGVVALVWSCARRLGRDPRLPALAVGLNPLVLVHAVGGAHNDALTVLLWMGGVAALIAMRPAREALAGAFTTAAGAVKASAGIVAPFMLIGARNRWALIAGAAAAALGVVIVAVIAFGDGALESLGVLSDNQDRTSRWSIPQRAADALAALAGGSAESLVDYTRVAFGALFVVALALLLRAAWRRRTEVTGWVAPAGWATLALLVASAWLVPWYAIWLMPLAALGADRRLLLASIAFCAYMMVIAMPLEPFSPY